MKQIISPLLRIGICTAGYLYATSNVTLAQVTSDGTVNTQVNQNGSIAEITGGETRGSNLFHSFQDFSVPTGNEAFFNNADSISNIFSRVTGGNISNIDGAIRANGSASLFLINPAGIIFGEGAKLDIGGSFYGSTASSILFEDGEFSAADLENPPLLTVNAPIGLGFRDNPGDIVNRSDFAETTEFREVTNEALNRVLSEISDELQLEIDERQFNGEESPAEILLDLGLISPDEIIVFEETNPIGLQVNQGNNFALIGGNVSIENSAISGADVLALGGLSQAGVVTFNQDGSLNFPEGVARGNVSFGVSSIDAIGLSTISASSIYTYAKKADFNNLRILTDDNLVIDASASVNVNNTALSGGDVVIKAVDITLTNDATSLGDISTSLPMPGEEVLNISINASGSLNLDNYGIVSFIQGNIDIETSNLNLNNSSYISTTTSSLEGDRDAGDIFINAKESVNISGLDPLENNFGSRIESTTFLFDDPSLDTASNNGGDININTPHLVVTDQGQIFTSTSGLGDAGNISINTANLTVADSGQILSSTSTLGKSGSISINASESISINGVNSDSSFSGIFNQIEQDAEGVAREINVVTKDLRLTNGGQISAVTRGEENAGNLNINTSNLDVKGINSGLFSRTAGSGNAGIVDIKTSQLQVQDNAQVGVDNFVPIEFQIEQLDNRSTIAIPIFNPVEGSGSAGNLRITAESIDLQSGGSLTAISAGGNGGNINLNSDLLTFRDGGNISATAGLENTSGSGGNINIDSQFIVAFPDGNNDITANAFSGAGGNISIATEGIFGIQERPNNPLTNDITASSEAGISGNVTITTPDINPVQGATELSTNVVEPGETTQQVCQANRETAAKNGLTISGKGGIVPDPALPLNSLNVTVNGKINPTSTIPAPIDTSQGKIQPARGIKVTESGKIILTAYRTNNAGERIPSSSVNCGRA